MKDAKTLEISDELHTCPGCGYDRGFHASFKRKGRAKALRLILICPNCGARYDIGKEI
ncbi:MAG: hypothetical protein AB1696_03855 [Planctomycetota bacterium]